MENDVRGEAHNARWNPDCNGSKVAHDEAVDKPPRRKRPDNTLHEGLIKALCAEFPQARRTGFRRTLQNLFPLEKLHFGLIPDAFLVDEAAKFIVAYEVEVSHLLSEEKLAEYAAIAWWVDNEEWTLGLVRIDRYGVARGSDPLVDDIDRIVARVQYGPAPFPRHLRLSPLGSNEEGGVGL